MQCKNAVNVLDLAFWLKSQTLIPILSVVLIIFISKDIGINDSNETKATCTATYKLQITLK